MRKLLLLLSLSALALGSLSGTLLSAPARSFGERQLKMQQKKQRKDLKQQQRAMKKVIDQHELSDEQRKRFTNDMKMQERLLHKSQKDDSRRLKQAQKVAKAASHPA